MLDLHPEASACGKVIVLGEHAVVYGSPALAAGLPDGLHLRATPLANRLDPMTVRISAWDLDLVLHPNTDHPVALACLDVLGWCDGPLTGWAIEGETRLPSRAGLGSSAALTVALAKLALGPDTDPSTLIEASLVGERVFHGEPSGIDSEVAARGGMVQFIRGEGVEPVPLDHPLSLLIVPSQVPRSTADQVAKVRARHDRHPTVIRPVLTAIGAAVGSGRQALETGDISYLGELMDTVQGLLAALDVSSPILDELCSIARTHGAGGAKLTGAGGGGCIIALPPTPCDALLQAYHARGLSPLSVTIS